METREIVEKLKCFLLDMDGTIYIDDEPIGDMKNTLSAIRDSGRKIVYLTNNSSKSASVYVEKLKRLGFYDERDYVYTSAMATAEFLLREYPAARIYAVATEAVKREFISYGLNLTEDMPDIALLTYDTELTYEKLAKFTRYIVKGARYIATHPDVNCPAKEVFLPDIGSFMKLIKESTGLDAEIIIGKPNKYMGECIEKRFGYLKSEICMVGDRLHTDILFGNNCGFNSLLVMSGETTEKIRKKSPVKPTFVLPSLNEIVKYP